MEKLQLPVSLVELVPHRPPMLWLDQLVEFSEDWGRVVGHVPPGHLFADGTGALHPSASIELLAQAAAAHEGYRRRIGGQPVGGGFLVGIRNFALRRAPRFDEELTVTAERRWTAGPMQVTSGSVRDAEGVLAEGEMTFFVSEESVPGELQVVGARDGAAAGNRADPCTAVQALALELDSGERESGPLRVCFSPSFPAFSGHFPGFPVLPAVVEVLVGAELLSRKSPGTVLRSVRRAKFARAITPGTTVTVECRQEGPAEAGEWRIRLLVDEEVAAMVWFGIERAEKNA